MGNLLKPTFVKDTVQDEIDRFEASMKIIKRWIIEGGELPTEIYLDNDN